DHSSISGIFAREHGSNKKLAAQSCALSLVRQLYHLSIIEAYSGQTKKKEGESVEPYDVNLTSNLENQLKRIVDDMCLEVISPPEDSSSPALLSIGKLAHFEPSQKQNQSGVVPWSPPQSNWNPWTSSNIDEGPLAYATPEQISIDIKSNLLYQLENDQELQKILQERETLPVKNFEQEILGAVHHSSVVIIRGATGCGKTTQVPQYILDECIHSGRAAECNIVVTQPRRISAVSVAERVAYERGEEPGNSCGYSVRFESMLPRPHASVMFCTVGVLLRKLEAGIRGISHVIVDEIHERDINTDFLLVVLRDVVQAYPEIRVILMSATIDTSMFCEYFFNCPIIEVFGRTYPVQEYFLEDCIQMTKFIPPPKDKKKKDKDEEGTEDDDANCNLICGDEYGLETKSRMAQMNEKETPFELIEALLKYIETLNVVGAVLVFLPGWNLIYTMQKYLEMNPHFGTQRYRVLPLHSQIPREEQRKVFDPVAPGITKVILSTNIAETSITINDVVYVIDSCNTAPSELAWETASKVFSKPPDFYDPSTPQMGVLPLLRNASMLTEPSELQKLLFSRWPIFFQFQLVYGKYMHTVAESPSRLLVVTPTAENGRVNHTYKVMATFPPPIVQLAHPIKSFCPLTLASFDKGLQLHIA
uniref:RNA helicase n=1 Tax=Laticauda laticaudata TaxID=8630 RepID=A0A8C5S2R9_LATLA